MKTLNSAVITSYFFSQTFTESIYEKLFFLTSVDGYSKLAFSNEQCYFRKFISSFKDCV